MPKAWSATAVFLALLFLTTLACALPTSPTSGPLPTPTVEGDSLELLIPAFTYNMQPGDTIPGTRLEYIGKTGDVFEVSIDGVTTNKRFGDSFIWSGIVAPGVHATYNLRLTTEIIGTLPVGGPVNLVILNPEPAAISTLPVNNEAFHYNNIFVTYNVPIGFNLPGTTLIYDGVAQQGEIDSARLLGTEGHPLFAVGDSITWIGTLRENVTASYTFRVVNYNEENLQVTGTAEIWVND